MVANNHSPLSSFVHPALDGDEASGAKPSVQREHFGGPAVPHVQGAMARLRLHLQLPKKAFVSRDLA